jgi:hypothetical protein
MGSREDVDGGKGQNSGCMFINGNLIMGNEKISLVTMETQHTDTYEWKKGENVNKG